MRNKITQIIAAGLLLVSFWGNAQAKRKTHDEMQQFMIDLSFEQADYIFEAEALGANEMIRYKDTTDMSSMWYQKLRIIKIYRGGKELKLGSALSLTWLDDHLRDKYHFQKAIYFAKKSDYPKPKLNEKMDNKVAVTTFRYLLPSKDSLGKDIYGGFGLMGFGYQIKGKSYYDIDNELFKNRKNIIIPKSEPIIEKKVVPLHKIETPEIIEDTTGLGARKAIEFEKQRAEADENMLRNIEEMILNDTVSIASRQFFYNHLKRNFYKSAAKYKELFIDTYKTNKKKSLNFRTEATNTTLASVDAQYSIKNKTITTAVGKNFYEFDVTLKATSTVQKYTLKVFFYQYKVII